VAVTRADVARAAGISPAVVSYVINNGPRPVSAEVRARVEAAIAELGYRPNTIASALRGGSSRSIGFLTPGLGSPQNAELAEALELHLAAHDYLMFTGTTHHDHSRERAVVRTFIERRADALIFGPGISLSTKAIGGLGSAPLLVVDDVPFRPENSTIRTEDSLDAAYAVEHLQGHGHQLIGCICGPSNRLSGTRPVLGWRTAQRAVGAPHGQDLVAHAESSEMGGWSATMQLLGPRGRVRAQTEQLPTALFVASDSQSIGTIAACYELGIRVPEDVAVVSLGGTRSARYANPPITSVRRDLDFIAATATQLVLERIQNPELPPYQTATRGNLVVEQSCGCTRRRQGTT
jgi:LacI family transcriptional regulator